MRISKYARMLGNRMGFWRGFVHTPSNWLINLSNEELWALDREAIAEDMRIAWGQVTKEADDE